MKTHPAPRGAISGSGRGSQQLALRRAQRYCGRVGNRWPRHSPAMGGVAVLPEQRGRNSFGSPQDRHEDEGGETASGEANATGQEQANAKAEGGEGTHSGPRLLADRYGVVDNGAPCRVRPLSIPDPCPWHIGTELVTRDRSASGIAAFVGGPLDGGALLFRDRPGSVEPRPHVASVVIPAGCSYSCLAAQDFSGSAQGGFLGRGVVLHAPKSTFGRPAESTIRRRQVFAPVNNALMDDSIRREHSAEERAALGQRLRSARLRAGFSLEVAAIRLTELGWKVEKQAVGHWETGTRVPDALVVTKLASIYQVPAGDLLEDTAQPVVPFSDLKGEYAVLFHRLQGVFSGDEITQLTTAVEEAARLKGGMENTHTAVSGSPIYFAVNRRQRDVVPELDRRTTGRSKGPWNGRGAEGNQTLPLQRQQQGKK